MGAQTCSVNTHQGHDKKKSSGKLGGGKPNQRRVRQSLHLAIAAKYGVSVAGFATKGKPKIFSLSAILCQRRTETHDSVSERFDKVKIGRRSFETNRREPRV